MPRPRNLDPLRVAVQDLGRLIGEELGASISSALTGVMSRAPAAPRVAVTPARRGRRALSAAEAPCAVPGCGKKRASWGLCSNHYQKARRLNMKPGALDVATLAKDGRATRWKK